jgi:hypothetical protein
VSVHFAPESSDIPVERLIQYPPTQLQLSDQTPITAHFGKLNLQLDAHQLPFTEKRILSYNEDEQCEFLIGDSNYNVKGPANVNYWDDSVPFDKARFRCWRASVSNFNDKTTYNVGSPRRWSLTAFAAENDWKPTAKMCVERVNT